MKTQNTHFIFRNVFPINMPLFSNLQKYGTAGKATGDGIIWHIHTSRWSPKATYTFSEYAILTAFPRQQWLLVQSQYYFIHTLLVSLLLTISNAYSTPCT